ncbi:MAG: DHA2 family efflux MFS transporter permease subunit [Chloroflexota bacterium]|nr:MAG: DHA2 family efflux MFS transporter permease subunit [Chloroflexota bacterium]
MPSRWAIWSAIGAGTFLNVLDNSMMNVSLPTVTREFASDVGTIQWVVTGYMLVISSLLLTGGRLADVYGRKRLYLAGLAIFTLASAIAGFSVSPTMLIACRIAQGVGSALVQGVGTAIVVSAFPSSERGRALGLNATVVALGGITGPILGGIVADTLGWRWIFWLRIPIAILCVAATARLVPNDTPTGPRRRFDVAGAVLIFIALATLLLALSQGRFLGWGSAVVIGLFATSAATWFAFVRVELRVPEPMLPLDVFKNRAFAGASAASFLSFCATSSSFFLMPFYLIDGLGFPASQAGFLMVPGAIFMSIAAPLSGTLSDRYGSRVLSPIGLLMIVAAFLSLSRLTADMSALDVVWRSALLGLGMGTFMSPNNNTLIGSVPRERVGLAAGTMASVRNLGNVVGVAIAGTILINRQEIYLPDLLAAGVGQAAAHARSLVGGIDDAYLIAGVLAFLALIVTSLRGASEPDRPVASHAEATSTSG